MGRVAAVLAALTVLAAGCSGRGTITPGPAKRGPVALPPPGALALAAQSGNDAVTIAVSGSRATVGMIAGDGLGVDGLTVTVNGAAASPCGYGCYRAPLVGRPTAAVVRLGSRQVAFALHTVRGRANALIAQTGRVLRRQSSTLYRERLSSGPGHTITTIWREQAPNRLSYVIRGGAAGIVIGGRRWDKVVGGSWVSSPQSPLTLPAAPWIGPVTNAHILAADSTGWTIAFIDRSTPAWFRLRIDRATRLPMVSDMTATAHFMRDVYLAYNRTPAIRPPG